MDKERQNILWNMAGSFCYAFASMVLSFLVMRMVGKEEGGEKMAERMVAWSLVDAQERGDGFPSDLSSPTDKGALFFCAAWNFAQPAAL